jgi:hypothetical protein
MKRLAANNLLCIMEISTYAVPYPYRQQVRRRIRRSPRGEAAFEAAYFSGPRLTRLSSTNQILGSHRDSASVINRYVPKEASGHVSEKNPGVRSDGGSDLSLAKCRKRHQFIYLACHVERLSGELCNRQPRDDLLYSTVVPGRYVGSVYKSI